ncbi:hypothetical protein FOA52_010622 [Chlamydomonas sp. UWO 241]|nr:hypothetical protein FOA52_010622 [Chlamydomonas sp. UWO 241]
MQHATQRTSPSAPASDRQTATSADGLHLDGDVGEDDITGQAVEILAGLTSLGISQALRDRVQDAMQQLESASASASASVPELKKKGHRVSLDKGEKAKAPAAAAAAAAAGKGAVGKSASQSAAAVEELETKLGMSRSIMRKLYRKNCDLEKEVQMLKANGCSVASLELTPTDGGTPKIGARGTSRPGALVAPHGGLSDGGAGSPSTPVALAIQERDRTITQLQAALDASRRRCALMEGSPSDGGGGSISGQGSKAAAAQQASIREVLAASQLHLSKYKNIRDDYNRLLKKRTVAVSTSKAASAEARALVDEMDARLSKEIQEREAEAALYSARLYESERLMSDWYVEKRMLELHIERLSEEVAQRDVMDQQMEACVCDLFERLRLVEETNKEMEQRLAVATGVQVAAKAPPVGGAATQK